MTPSDETTEAVAEKSLAAYTDIEPTPILDFIAKMTDTLAWPILVLIIALIFRRQILQTISSLKSFRFGNAEAKFEQGLQDATEKAQAIEPASEEIVQASTPRRNELLRMAGASPTGAIIEAWKDVEQAVRELARNNNLLTENNRPQPAFNLIRLLAREELLPKPESETISELRVIRNQAAHLNDYVISKDQASRYVDLADRIVDSIQTIISDRDD